MNRKLFGRMTWNAEGAAAGGAAGQQQSQAGAGGGTAGGQQQAGQQGQQAPNGAGAQQQNGTGGALLDKLGLGGQQKAQNGVAGQQQQQSANGAAYHPESLAQDLRGASDKETIDRMNAALGSLRGDLDKRKPPEKADAYKLELPQALAESLKHLADDPALAVWKEASFAAGLDNGQFNAAISNFYTKLGEKGLLPKPVDPDAEIARLAPGIADPKQREARAREQASTAVAFLQGAINKKQLTEGQGQVLAALMGRASGIELVNALAKLAAGEHGVQPGGQGGGISQSDLMARLKDPRYDSNSSKYDPAFRKETDDLWQRHFAGREARA